LFQVQGLGASQVMGVEKWQARWHALQKPQEKRGFPRQIERATDPKKWHALARNITQSARLFLQLMTSKKTILTCLASRCRTKR